MSDEKLNEAVEIITEMVTLNCMTTGVDGKPRIDSMSIGTYCDAIYFLSGEAKVIIIKTVGRRIIAKWND